MKSRQLLFFDLFSLAAFVVSGVLLLQVASIVSAPPRVPSAAAAGVSPNAPNIATSSATASLNWSGYVASASGSYTAVLGTWVVPNVDTQSSGLAADATWVGVGGVASDDLIQAGTQTVEDDQGDIIYEPWYEVMPQDSQSVPMNINPGDTVAVSLAQGSPGQWHIAFTDSTSGATYSTDVAYESSLSSAEWIEEMPSSGEGNFFIPLDNFGSVQFLSGSATKDGVSQSLQTLQAQPLSMLSLDDETLAYPSALGSDGSSFIVSRTGAPAVSLTSHHRRGRGY